MSAGSPTRAGDSPNGGQFDPAQIALLKTLRGGTLLPKLLVSYRQQSFDLIGEVEAAWGASNLDALQRSAHTLKSSSFSIGAKPLGELGAQIEAVAKGRLDGSLAELVAALRDRHAALLVELDAMLAP